LSIIKNNKFFLKCVFICHYSTKTNLSDKIISVSLEKQVVILKDSDIGLSLVAQSIQYYIEERPHRTQLRSLGLF
jgi:hypothetical protein